MYDDYSDANLYSAPGILITSNHLKFGYIYTPFLAFDAYKFAREYIDQTDKLIKYCENIGDVINTLKFIHRQEEVRRWLIDGSTKLQPNYPVGIRINLKPYIVNGSMLEDYITEALLFKPHKLFITDEIRPLWIIRQISNNWEMVTIPRYEQLIKYSTHDLLKICYEDEAIIYNEAKLIYQEYFGVDWITYWQRFWT